jgi:translation elongation factor EF-1beta
MELYNYFSEDYEIIDAKGNDRHEAIEIFLEDSERGKEYKYSEPLKTVFVHKTGNEMFLILDCVKLDFVKIKAVCKEWEEKVLNFVNFGKEFRENIEFLKYNITLLILCKDKNGNIDDDLRFEMEKSTIICRKIFLLCDDTGNILNNEKIIIPFYFEPIKTVKNSKTEELERELKSSLPSDYELQSICEKENLTFGDIKKMYRWMERNDYN